MHWILAVVAAATLAAGVYVAIRGFPNRRGDASTPVNAIRRALYDLDHYHLQDFCRDFTPAARAADAAPELFSVSDCGDAKLLFVQRHCAACRKGDTPLSFSSPMIVGDGATVRITVADDKYAVKTVTKTIHLERSGGEWLLEDNPEATQ